MVDLDVTVGGGSAKRSKRCYPKTTSRTMTRRSDYTTRKSFYIGTSVVEVTSTGSLRLTLPWNENLQGPRTS